MPVSLKYGHVVVGFPPPPLPGRGNSFYNMFVKDIFEICFKRMLNYALFIYLYTFVIVILQDNYSEELVPEI